MIHLNQKWNVFVPLPYVTGLVIILISFVGIETEWHRLICAYEGAEVQQDIKFSPRQPILDLLAYVAACMWFILKGVQIAQFLLWTFISWNYAQSIWLTLKF